MGVFCADAISTKKLHVLFHSFQILIHQGHVACPVAGGRVIAMLVLLVSFYIYLLIAVALVVLLLTFLDASY